MSKRDLIEKLRPLPPESLVPVGWVLELAGEQDGEQPVGDYTIPEAATIAKRSASTVRSWCASGELEGAYRFRSREWRIPPSALERFLEQQREGKRPARDSGPVDLGSWRQHRKDDAA